MGLQTQSRDRRRMIVLGCLCLSFGLLLPEVFHPTGRLELNSLHFVRGLLIGMSLTINLGALWSTSRQRRSRDV